VEVCKESIKHTLRFARRIIAVGSIITVVWVAVGSIWFPDWWYEVFWRGQSIYLSDLREGWDELVYRETTLLIVLCAVGIVLSALGYLHKTRLWAVLEAWAFRLALICTFTVLGVALVLLKTPAAERAEARSISEGRLRAAQMFMDDSYAAPPLVEAPLVFQYLDKTRLSALYSEIESEFPEQGRTISSERSGSLAVGLGNSKAEASGKATETSSYQRRESSVERKCVDLLNFLLSNRKIAYYTTAQEWRGERLARIDRALGAAAMLAGRSYPEGVRVWPAPPPEGSQLRALNNSLRAELSRASGLVIFTGTFRTTPGPPGIQQFEAVFGELPERVAFRFSHRAQSAVDPLRGGLPYRVFGCIAHRLDAGGYVEIQPIAVF